MELALKNESEKRQALMSELQSLKQLDKKLENGLSSFFCVIFFKHAAYLWSVRVSQVSQSDLSSECAFTV
jgi:hypothetical protein